MVASRADRWKEIGITREKHRAGPADIGTLDVRLQTKDELIHLPIVADLATAKSAFMIGAEKARCRSGGDRGGEAGREGDEVTGIIIPTIKSPPAVDADVEAGPSEDGGRRWKRTRLHCHVRGRCSTGCAEADNSGQECDQFGLHRVRPPRNSNLSYSTNSFT